MRGTVPSAAGQQRAVPGVRPKGSPHGSIDPMAGSGQSYDSSTRAGKVGIANMINNGYKKGNLTKTQAKAIAAHYGISID